jgi:hypothetical protein
MEWIYLAQDMSQWQALVNTTMKLWVAYSLINFLGTSEKISISKRTQFHDVSSYLFCSKICGKCFEVSTVSSRLMYESLHLE